MTAAFGMGHDARFAIKQQAPNLSRGEANLLGIPGHVQSREWPAASWAAHLRSHARHLRDLTGNEGIPGFPFAEVGLDVAPGAPHLHCLQHAGNLFLAHFETPAESVVRSAVGPGRAYQIAPANQQTSGLRTTDN